MCRRTNSIKNELIDKDNPNLKYYDVKLHKIIIRILIVVSFFVALWGIPWIIGMVEMLFRCICRYCWNDTPIGWWEFNLGILPDFLGGMVGILVGFWFESRLFSKLRIISKYEAILNTLSIELNNIKKCLTDKNEIHRIKLIALDDIVLIADNSTIIYSLPKLSLKKTRGEIYKKLLQIYGYIVNNYAPAVKKYAEEESDENKELCKKYASVIVENINQFFKATGLEKQEDTEGKINV